MHIFGIKFFIISLLSRNWTFALPRSDEIGQSMSGRSLDDTIQLMHRNLPTHLKGEDDIIRMTKWTLTQAWSQYLGAEYPKKNILIYHNQNSIFEGINVTHRTFDLTSDNISGNHTYEVQLFDSGKFSLAGEDGYDNWAIYGNWSKSGRSVEFYTVKIQSGKSRTGRSPTKMGGGFIIQSLEESEIRSRSDVSYSWSEPGYDPSSDSYDTSLNTPDEGASIESAFISFEEGAGGGIEILEAIAALGPAIEATLVLLAFLAVITAFFSVLVSFIDFTKQHATERAFTRSYVASHASAAPDLNIIVFHNQDSSFSFNSWSHVHYELPLNFFKKTQGYEIYSFDYGTFTLSGDGGYENWAFLGNYDREGESSFVTFYPRQASTCTPAIKSRDNTGKPLRLRQPIPPVIPTRGNYETKDGYYFVSCDKPDNTKSLGIAYYENMEPGGMNIGQLPDYFAEVYSNYAGVQAWEGEGHINFDTTGMSFRWNLMHTGLADDTAAVGIASTNFEQFWVYKSIKELLFNTTTNWTCNSLFYIF